jgi:hypothetical protein
MELDVIVIMTAGTDVYTLAYAAMPPNMDAYLVIDPAIFAQPTILSDRKCPW